MRSRTLCLLAVSAAVAAMTAAIPALAASSPVARGARTRHCNVVVVISHGRRVHACLIRGPRGPRGLPGPASTRGPQGIPGKNGKNGKNGATGKNGTNGTNGTDGTNGTNGTARAYAVISPSLVSTTPSAAGFIATQTHGFATVSSPSAGVYCLVATGISSANEPASVTGESSYSSSGFVPLAVLSAQASSCSPGEFEVITYNATSPTAPATGVAFIIIVP
jgi:hypothetical protein